jgi:hypothetical protein
MSGQQRLSREGTRKVSTWSSDLNFGLIAFVLLSAVAIIVAWKFPEFQMQYVASPQRRPQVSAPPAPSSQSRRRSGRRLQRIPLGSDVDRRRGRRRSAVGIANLHDQAGRMMSIGAQVCPPVGV